LDLYYKLLKGLISSRYYLWSILSLVDMRSPTQVIRLQWYILSRCQTYDYVFCSPKLYLLNGLLTKLILIMHFSMKLLKKVTTCNNHQILFLIQILFVNLIFIFL